jgi:hypothetical protein
MTLITDTQVINVSGGLVELGYSEITSTVTVSSTSEGASGTNVIPALTVVCDGSPVLVEFVASRVHAPGNASGNLTITNLLYDGANQGRLTLTGTGTNTEVISPAHGAWRMTPSAGVHTFAVTAFRTNANGYIWNDSNGKAFLRVSKIVQASQWPAVTTGIIVCTSTTRPSSPFTGQIIYEADTGLYQTYNGTSWGVTTNIGGLLTSSNFSTSGTANVTGLLTAGNFSTGGTANVTGLLTAGNFSTGGTANVTGLLTAGNFSTSGTGNVGGLLTTGNFSTSGTGNVGSSLTVTGLLTTGNFSTGGTGNVGGLLTTGNFSTGGTGNVGGLLTTGNFSTGGTGNVTGLLTAGNFSTSGTGNVGSSLTVGTNISALSGNVHSNRFTQKMSEVSYSSSQTILNTALFTSAGTGGIIVFSSSALTLTLPLASSVSFIMPTSTSSFDFIIRALFSGTLSATSTGITLYRHLSSAITSTTSIAANSVIFCRYVQTGSGNASIYMSV